MRDREREMEKYRECTERIEETERERERERECK